MAILPADLPARLLDNHTLLLPADPMFSAWQCDWDQQPTNLSHEAATFPLGKKSRASRLIK